MPTALAVHNFQTLLTRLTHAANLAVGQLWHGTQHWQDISDGYPNIMDPFLAAAAQLSAQWYHSLAPDAAFAVQPGPLPPAEQLSKNADYSFSTADPLSALQGATERHVFATSGATIVHNADREHVRYARYASATACAFCRVLATRAPVYTSAASATRVGASGRTRGTRKIGDLYHDNCHCIAVPVRPGDDYQPPDYVKQWEADYDAANRDPDVHSFDQIVNHMRRTDYARTKPSKPERERKTAEPADPLAGVRRKPDPKFDPVPDIEAINPNFKDGKQWQNNCPACTTANELRHRGYDVTAKPDVDGESYAEILKRWRSPDGSIAGTSTRTATRRPTAGETLGMSDGNRVFHTLPAGSGATNKARVDAAVTQWGEGSRGYIGVTWKGRRSAHIFNVENRDGKIIYTDGQTNKTDADSSWDKVSPGENSVYVVRTDDLTPSKDVMDWVRERTDAEVAAGQAKAEAQKRVAAGPAPHDVIQAAESRGYGVDSGKMGHFARGAQEARMGTQQIPSDYSSDPDIAEAYMRGIFWYRRWRDTEAAKKALQARLAVSAK